MTPEEELRALGWRLIEWKVAYYRPEVIHGSHGSDYDVSDDEYDAAEVRYLTLCRELNVPNVNVHKSYPGFEDMTSYKDGLGNPVYPMFEVDYTRGSVQLVLSKLQTPKRKRK